MYQVKALSAARARIRADLDIDWKPGDINQVDDNMIAHYLAHPSVFQIVSEPGDSLVTSTVNPLTGGIEFSPAVPIVYILEQSAVPAALTGTTAETTLATIDAPAMGLNDSLRITALFTFTSSVNLKTMFGKINNATFAQNSTSTSGHAAARVQWQVSNRNNTASQLGTPFGMGFTAGAATSPLNPAVQTAGANTVLIRGQLASAAETLTLEGYTVELIRA